MLKDYLAVDRDSLACEYEKTEWDMDSGLPPEELRRQCRAIEKACAREPKSVIKAKLEEFVLDHAQIAIHPRDMYADQLNHDGILRSFREKWLNQVKAVELRGKLDTYRLLEETRSFTSAADFGHTCPDWEYVLSRGFRGILDNLEEKSRRTDLSEEQKLFYENARLVSAAVLRFVSRLADQAGRECDTMPYGKLMATSLRNLTQSAPHTLHEALQFILLYYEVQQHLDCCDVRSLGNLDSLLLRFYERDRKAGLIEEADARVMLKYFFLKLYAKKCTANIPFCICGSDQDGHDLTNEMTFLILEEYIALDILDPKIHVRYHDGLDKRVLRMVLSSIVAGRNSFLIMNDRIVEQSLLKIGIAPEDVYNYMIVGCYEPCAVRKEIPCSCNGRVNIPKAVELAMTDGIDLMTGWRLMPSRGLPKGGFEEFLKRVESNLRFLCDCCMDLVNEYEKYYMQVNPAPFFSGAFEESMEKAVDLYAGGAKYNNSSVNAFGLATAVDSLIAVKKAVYEEKRLSLEEFADLLKKDWEGEEQLYYKCKSLYPKYGNHSPEPDELMVRLCGTLAKEVNGKPNGRGGVYRLGMFSIDWRFEFGRYTGATPDGRKAGETLSKNMCAVLGCDKGGVTALMNSVGEVDFTGIPNGTVLDIVLHKSAVNGEDGLEAMLGLLLAYMKKGGNAVHFNVLNPEELRKAQDNPAAYRTLQVRLCGWNVYFVDLSRNEQDEFIRQLEYAKD